MKFNKIPSRQAVPAERKTFKANGCGSAGQVISKQNLIKIIHLSKEHCPYLTGRSRSVQFWTFFAHFSDQKMSEDNKF